MKGGRSAEGGRVPRLHASTAASAPRRESGAGRLRPAISARGGAGVGVGGSSPRHPPLRAGDLVGYALVRLGVARPRPPRANDAEGGLHGATSLVPVDARMRACPGGGRGLPGLMMLGSRQARMGGDMGPDARRAPGVSSPARVSPGACGDMAGGDAPLGALAWPGPGPPARRDQAA